MNVYFLGGMKLMRKLIVLSALLLVAPAISQAKTLEDLLAEKGVITKAEAGSAGSASTKVYWNDGTRIEFPDNGFNTQINTDISTGYTFTDNKHASNVSSFDVQRARLIVQGNALNSEFSYVLRAEMAGSPELLDANITWHACDWAGVTMGQGKTGVSRQFNTDEHNLQFADESSTSKYFNLGRQSGATVNTDWKDYNMTLGAGIYNGLSSGEGMNTGGTDTKHTAVVNARYNVMGSQDPYVESDLANTADAALSLGAAYGYSKFTDPIDDHTMNSVSVDTEFKYQGWSLNGELFVQNEKNNNIGGHKPSQVGFYVQGGYFIMPKMELAARYGRIGCDSGEGLSRNGFNCTGLDNINEVDVSLNYYWWNNNLKGQIGYSHENLNASAPGASDLNTDRWLVRLSSYL